MFEQRDAYAASQARGLGCGFWSLWVIVTTVGGVLGQGVGQSLIGFLPDDASDTLNWLALVIAGAVLGICVGILQGAFLLRYIKASGWRDWILASVVGGILRWAVLGPVGFWLIRQMNTGIPMCNLLIPLALYSAVAGAAFGLPQAFALNLRLKEGNKLDKWAWTLAYAAGGVFYMPIIMLSGLAASSVAAMSGFVSSDYEVRTLIAATIYWLITGIITGLPLRDALRYVNRSTYVFGDE